MKASSDAEAVLSALEIFRGTFPRQALEAAAAGEPAVREGLLLNLQTAAAEPLKLSPQATGHLIGMVLLAAWREPRAFAPLLQLLALPAELVDHVLHETVDTLLPRALASTCAGREAELVALAEVAEAYDYCRMAAIRALKIQVLQQAWPRAELIGFVRRLISRLPKRIDAFPWDLLIREICQIHPGELAGEFRSLFAAGLVNPYFLRLEHLEAALAEAPEVLEADARELPENRPISEPLTEIAKLRIYEAQP